MRSMTAIGKEPNVVQPEPGDIGNEKSTGHHEHSHSEEGHAHHNHDTKDTSDSRLFFALLLNLGITVAEVIGGILSNSLALLSDAVHNLSDTSSMGISWIARHIARLEKDPRHSYGFERAEVLAALLNTTVLLGIGVFLLVEAARKVLHPEPVHGTVMMVVACIGLAGNLLTALLLHSGSKRSLNIRSTYLHIVMDTLSSVGVIVAALLIRRFGWYILDPLFTLLVALYVLKESIPVLRESVHILMQGTPPAVSPDEMAEAATTLEGVLDMHHIHLWTTDGNKLFIEAHVRLCEEMRGKTDQLLEEVTTFLRDRFNVGHSTLQFEFGPCITEKCGTGK